MNFEQRVRAVCTAQWAGSPSFAEKVCKFVMSTRGARSWGPRQLRTVAMRLGDVFCEIDAADARGESLSSLKRARLIARARRKPDADEIITCPEAVTLREAALEFGKHAGRKSRDQHDRRGVSLNRKLLKSALMYAARVRELTGAA